MSARAKGIILLGGVILWVFQLAAQEKKAAKVEVKHADFFKIETQNNNRYRLIGNVYLTHGNMQMWCDSLYQYPDSNYLEAFGHVRAIQNDSIHLSGDYMFYDANTKKARMRHNVTLRDPRMTLTTHFLDYDGLFEIGFYYHNGRIKDETNTLDSKEGTYFTQTKIAFFKDSVVVNSPEYTIYSDTLKYKTDTKLVSILGPTHILGKGEEGNTLYSEEGWYDTKLGHAELYKNNRITHLSYTGIADTMIMDSIRQEALLRTNVSLIDTINRVIIQGHLAHVDQTTQRAFVTDSTVMILVGKQDSLYLHGDTLFLDKDSLNQNILRAYPNVRFFSRDLQGVCDSMVYLTGDSTVTLYHSPVVWASGNQLTGETISLLTGNGSIKEFHLNLQAMMIARRGETDMYDQIKGRNITGYFSGNELHTIFVNGNGETIYYPDDKGVIIGANKATSSNIRIHIRNRRIHSIAFLNKPEGKLNPLFQVDPLEYRLKGFRWHPELQPRDRHDIFTIPQATDTKTPATE